MTDDLKSLRSLVDEEVERLLQEQQDLEKELAASRRSGAKLQEFANQMAILNQIFVFSADAASVDELLAQTVASLLELLELDFGRAYLLSKATRKQPVRAELYYAQENPQQEFSDEEPFEVDQSPWSFVFQDGLPIVSDQFPQLLPARMDGPSFRVAALVPIMAGFEVLGGLGFACRRREVWSDTDVNTLQAIGQQIGMLIAKMRADEERRRLVSELSTRNSELERFSYTVSHELKNPLVTIKGFLGMMHADLQKKRFDGVERHLSKIASAADTLTELLDGLREISGVGRICQTSEEVDLSDLAREAFILLEQQVAEKAVRIEVGETLPVVFGDRLRLLQLMLNLLDNAIKFQRGEHGRIEIGAEWREGGPVCYVRDNGIGIEVQYLERIFGLFEQLDPSHDGTGVGLALASRIAEHHGGRIWAESKGPGHGATFYFVLPEMAPLRF